MSVTVTGDRYPVVRFDNLVLTLGKRAGEGYEMLVEVDTDETLTTVEVVISTATEEVARLEL